MNKFLIIVTSLFLFACSTRHEESVLQVPNVSITLQDTPTLNTVAKAKKVKTITLNEKEYINLIGEVDISIMGLVEKLDKMNRTNIPAIYILINSPGGSVLDGAQFISAMEASKKPVYTVCMGICASMAAVIHQYGKERYMLDRSILMFHDASGALMGTLPQMQSRLTFITRLTTKMDAFIAVRSGTSLDKFLTDIKSEVWLDAEDATTKNLNDEIVYISLPDAAPFVFDEGENRNKANSHKRFSLENI